MCRFPPVDYVPHSFMQKVQNRAGKVGEKDNPQCNTVAMRYSKNYYAVRYQYKQAERKSFCYGAENMFLKFYYHF